MSHHTREVITFQLGHYSNFIGSHFWNIQESAFIYDKGVTKKEINNDVLFREGLTLRREVTYTPRAIIFDLKGSLGSLKQEGVLYHNEINSDEKVFPNIHVEQETIVDKNDFLKDLQDLDEKAAVGLWQNDIYANKVYDLDSVVNVWSDYLRIHLHPKSVQVTSRYTHDSITEPFDYFPLGQNLFKEPAFHDDLEDRIHFFIEECDSLQGFNIFVDVNNASGGLCFDLIQELSDLYSNKCITTWGVIPPCFDDSSIDRLYQIQNMLINCVKLTELSSGFIPISTGKDILNFPNSTISMPLVNYKPHIPYHSSALLALNIDTASLPFRLLSNNCSMADLLSVLTPHGRKILCLNGASPLVLSEESTVFDTLISLEDNLPWQSLCPNVSSKLAPTLQCIVARGIKQSMLLNPFNNETLKLGPCNSAKDLLEYYFHDIYPTTLTSVHDIDLPTKIASPFPNIFSSSLSVDGLLSKYERPATQPVKSIPVMTSLQSSTSIQSLLTGLIEFTKKFPMHRFSRILNSGLEEDEYKEIISQLHSLNECYSDDVDML